MAIAVANTRPVSAAARVRSKISGHPALMGAAVYTVMISVGRVHEILPGITGGLPLGKMGTLFALVILALDPAARRRLRPLFTSRARFFWILIAAIFASVPFSYFIMGSLDGLKRVIPPSLALVVVIVGAIGSRRELEKVVRAFVVCVILLGGAMALGLGEYKEAWTGVRQSISEMYDANDLALVAVCSMPFALLLLRDRAWVSRLVGVLGVGFAALIVVRSGSRGGFIALTAVLLPALFGVRALLSMRLRVFLAVALVVSVAFLPEDFMNRVGTLTELDSDYNATSTTGRLEIAKRGVTYFLSRPLTGVGFSAFPVAEGRWARAQDLQGFRWMAPHSIYVQAGAELGIPGLIGLLGILGLNLRAARRAVRAHRDKRIEEATLRNGLALRSATYAFAVGGAFLSAAYSPLLMLLASIGIGYTWLLDIELSAPIHRQATTVAVRSLSQPRLGRRR